MKYTADKCQGPVLFQKGKFSDQHRFWAKVETDTTQANKIDFYLEEFFDGAWRCHKKYHLWFCEYFLFNFNYKNQSSSEIVNQWSLNLISAICHFLVEIYFIRSFQCSWLGSSARRLQKNSFIWSSKTKIISPVDQCNLNVIDTDRNNI